MRVGDAEVVVTVDWTWFLTGVAAGLVFAAAVVYAVEWLNCRVVERECDDDENLPHPDEAQRWGWPW